MNKIEYTKMFELEDSHFWFVGKRYFIDTFLKPYKSHIKTILDLGSGTGGATKFLEKYGKVTGIENFEYAINLARRRGVNIKKGDINSFRTNGRRFDLVTILDVLYHQRVKDEKAVLRRVYESLNKNGYLLITDSALNFLKSRHDVAVEGKRRYKLTEIKKIVESSGFTIIKASYIYFSLFPAILLKRFITKIVNKENESDVGPINPLINKILLEIIKLEAKILSNVSFPIGSSVILLARKNEEPRRNRD